MRGTYYSYHIVTKLDISRQTFEKYSNIKFQENPLMGVQLFDTDGRTDKQMDRYVETNSLFSQFCEKRLQNFILFECFFKIIFILRTS